MCAKCVFVVLLLLLYGYIILYSVVISYAVLYVSCKAQPQGDSISFFCCDIVWGHLSEHTFSRSLALGRGACSVLLWRIVRT